MDIKLFVVIAVYNRITETIQCLHNLRYQSYKGKISIVLVDDGSTDNTREQVKELFPDVIIISGSGNWWWTKSMNKGIRNAIESGASNILILNNDIEIKPNYIENLLTAQKVYPNSIIGSLNLTSELPARIYYGGIKKLNWLTAKGVKYNKVLDLYDKNIHKGIFKTSMLPGRGTLIPVFVFNKIGLLDENRFPQYFSDNDFIVTAAENNISSYISYDAILYTSLVTTGGGDIYKGGSYVKFFRSFFDRYSKRHLPTVFKYYWKHTNIFQFPFALVLHNVRVIFSFFKNRNKSNG